VIVHLAPVWLAPSELLSRVAAWHGTGWGGLADVDNKSATIGRCYVASTGNRAEIDQPDCVGIATARCATSLGFEEHMKWAEAMP
jgi:hypothetical protein